MPPLAIAAPARRPPAAASLAPQVAVEGCCHGELDKIYETLAYLEAEQGTKVDLLLVCGDFQAVRNMDDLECMACPPKYRALQTFYKYYSGELTAPVPTIFSERGRRGRGGRGRWAWALQPPL